MIDRRYLVRYIAPTGKTWELSSSTWIAGIRRAGIKELIGRPEATGIETLGVPGRAIEGLRFPAIEGSLDLFVRAGQGRHAHDIWAEFRHSFSILRRWARSRSSHPWALCMPK